MSCSIVVSKKSRFELCTLVHHPLLPILLRISERTEERGPMDPSSLSPSERAANSKSTLYTESWARAKRCVLSRCVLLASDLSCGRVLHLVPKGIRLFRPVFKVLDLCYSCMYTSESSLASVYLSDLSVGLFRPHGRGGRHRSWTCLHCRRRSSLLLKIDASEGESLFRIMVDQGVHFSRFVQARAYSAFFTKESVSCL